MNWMTRITIGAVLVTLLLIYIAFPSPGSVPERPTHERIINRTREWRARVTRSSGVSDNGASQERVLEAPPAVVRVSTIRVSSPEDAPVRDALVYLLETGIEGVEELGSETPHAVTGEDGTCTFVAIEGERTLGVKARGLETLVRRVILPTSSESAVLDVKLERKLTISGSIQETATGKPVADCVVSITQCTRDGSEYRSWYCPGDGGLEKVAKTTLTDTAGHFNESGLSKGTYLVRCIREGYAVKDRIVQLPCGNIGISLDRSAVLLVQVVNWDDRQGRMLRCRVWHPKTNRIVNSMSCMRLPDGVAKFGERLPSGEFDVEFESEGLGVAREHVKLAYPGQVLQMAVTLSPGLLASVSLSSHERMAGWLALYDRDGNVVRVIDAEGDEVKLEVVAQEYRIEYFDRERLSAKTAFGSADAGHTLSLTPQMATTFQVRGPTPAQCKCEDAKNKAHLYRVIQYSGEVEIGSDCVVREHDIGVLGPDDGLTIVLPKHEGAKKPLEVGRLNMVESER